MSLTDRVEDASPQIPLGTAHVGPAGGEFTDLRSDAPITDWDDALRRLGVDPASFQVVGDTITVKSWQQSKRLENGDRDTVTLFAYSGRIEPRRDAVDLPALFASAARKPAKPLKPSTADRVTVVVLADVQAGKTGGRGGTPELIDRLVEKQAKLAAHLRTRRPASTVLVEAGDLFENFESGGNPAFTNDLSLAEQMDLAGTIVFDFVKVMYRHGPVQVVAVPSNHTAWRRGKTELGRPQDDLGLFVHRQVQKVAVAGQYVGVEWVFPADWDESAVIDVLGTRVGVTHGHRTPKGRIVDWWAKQAHGGQPVGAADVLISGHFHQFICMPTGRNPITGRVKWWLQAPTLDNGSEWFRNMSGEDSDPGLLVFDIGPDGFDLQSLAVL